MKPVTCKAYAWITLTITIITIISVAPKRYTVLWLADTAAIVTGTAIGSLIQALHDLPWARPFQLCLRQETKTDFGIIAPIGRMEVNSYITFK